ncbi:MAG TPA: hypothetical protein VFW73_12210 [Lacipirellulaceae bacterium]|nr:hypothetical protein [Lacipirellulaceae bacterium]
MLVDQAEGLPPLINGIISQIEMNRLTDSEMRETMNRLAAELKRLSGGPLSVAGRELTSARKTVELFATGKQASDSALYAKGPQQLASLSRSVASAVGSQNEVIATLEKLSNELSAKTDYRQLIRQIAELREDQLAHAKLAKSEIGKDTLPLDVAELSPSQRAMLDKASDSQVSISVRYAKLERSMDQLARKLSGDRDPMPGTLNDAVDLSHTLTIGANMQQTATDWRENRIGQAFERESRIAGDLQRVVDVLRNEGEHRPRQLVDKLKQAEQRLAALRKQLEQLKQQVAQTEHTLGPANSTRLRQLGKQQQSIRQNIERLSRDLERLQAAEAGQTTQSAADQLARHGTNNEHGQANAGRPSSSGQVGQAENKLAQAAQQLAARRQEAEFDLALEIVRRFETQLGEMVKRQQRVIKSTADLDAGRRPNVQLSTDQTKTVAKLAGEEHQLAELAKEHSELLYGLGAVRVSLEKAEERLTSAGKLLEARETGPVAQAAEQLSLARLEAMQQAFAQTASEAGQTPKTNNGSSQAAANNQQQPQPRPTFELLEVKMLRMLQADLNERTRQHEQRMAAAGENPAEKASLSQEAAALASEQGRLAELVQKMILRDNEQQQQQP